MPRVFTAINPLPALEVQRVEFHEDSKRCTSTAGNGCTAAKTLGTEFDQKQAWAYQMHTWISSMPAATMERNTLQATASACLSR